MFESHPPTLDQAWARIQAIDPAAYAKTRNALDGAVTGLSPYLSHGLIALTEVLATVAARHSLPVQHKFVFELGWRGYFHHVWQHRGGEIFQSLGEGPLPDGAYLQYLPDDIHQGQTGIPVIDAAVRCLYATGWLHNHARMWLASYVVHVRKVAWRVGADWLYGHLLDGDLASNHLSWQWVAGTGSSKPYLFNAENVARYAPAEWHSPGTVIDASYSELDQLARTPPKHERSVHKSNEAKAAQHAPALYPKPPSDLGLNAPDPAHVLGRDVWLVHPWCLGPLPAHLPEDVLVLGLYVQDFHGAWPWSANRWNFVNTRMTELTPLRWWGDALSIGQALTGARRVRSISEPHLAPWLENCARCEAKSVLFPQINMRCDSFSKWWTRAVRGMETAADLLENTKALPC